MGNSPPPVKSLPDLEAGLASGIIFAVSSLWPNSGRPEGWRSRHSPTSPFQGRAIAYDSERAASASLPLKRGGMGWGSRPPPDRCAVDLPLSGGDVPSQPQSLRITSTDYFLCKLGASLCGRACRRSRHAAVDTVILSKTLRLLPPRWHAA